MARRYLTVWWAELILFNICTMLNSIEQDEILNKEFVGFSYVHYLCIVQSN